MTTINNNDPSLAPVSISFQPLYGAPRTTRTVKVGDIIRLAGGDTAVIRITNRTGKQPPLIAEMLTGAKRGTIRSWYHDGMFSHDAAKNKPELQIVGVSDGATGVNNTFMPAPMPAPILYTEAQRIQMLVTKIVSDRPRVDVGMNVYVRIKRTTNNDSGVRVVADTSHIHGPGEMTFKVPNDVINGAVNTWLAQQNAPALNATLVTTGSVPSYIPTEA